MRGWRNAGAAVLATAAMLLAGHAAGRELVVGVEQTLYLPQYGYENDEFKGFARELLDTFAKQTNHTVRYRALPIRRLFKEMVDGTVDLKYPDNPEWMTDVKAGKPVVYSAVVVEAIDGVSVMPARKGLGMAGLKTLGTVSGFTAFGYLDARKAGTLAIQENDSFTGLVRMTVAGRVDGAYANVPVVMHALKQLGQPHALVFDPDLPHAQSNYHLSSTKAPDIVAAFDGWMKANAAAVRALKAGYAVEVKD